VLESLVLEMRQQTLCAVHCSRKVTIITKDSDALLLISIDTLNIVKPNAHY
jgi:hypothetical protein